MSTDFVTPEFRLIEKEIDNSHKSNALVKLGFAAAAWYLLAYGEETILKPFVRGEELPPQYEAALVDNLIFNLNYPLRWLFVSCRQGGEVPYRYDDNFYKAAWDLFTLGENYADFYTVFTLASRGIVKLQLDGSMIVPEHHLTNESQYEAYNRLIKPSSYGLNRQVEAVVDFSAVDDVIMESLSIQGDRFSYELSPRLIRLVKGTLKPFLHKIFVLPDNWKFSRYSLGDFRQVFEAILAVAFVHWDARVIAASHGCIGLGYVDSIFIADYEELLGRITNYSGVPSIIVSQILRDLTYGNCGILKPDPAIQPLIPLKSNLIAIMPNLWINNSAERNLTVLLNRLPTEIRIYACLVNEKELLMRNKIKTMLSQLGFRFADGDIPKCPHLPDIDLAVISDTEKALLIFELKWFIEPAETREGIDRSEDLRKGISQLLQLKRAFETNCQPLYEKLQVNNDYSLCLAVVSANWIGLGDVQSPEIPIIKDDHIIQQIVSARSVRVTMEWLSRRAYLPIDGIHYEIVDVVSKIGDWSVKWYRIKPIVQNEFLPL